MAYEQIDPITNKPTGRWLCGMPSRDGSPCQRYAQRDSNTKPEDWTCYACGVGSSIIPKEGGRPLPRPKLKYDDLLPDTIRDYFDEDSDEVLSLRPKIAVLDAFLKRKFTQLSSVSGGVDYNQAVKLLVKALALPITVDVRAVLDELLDHLKRAANEQNLELDIRNLIQEIATATKQETTQMVALGQVISIDRFMEFAKELHAISLRLVDSEPKQQELTTLYFELFRKHTKPQ